MLAPQQALRPNNGPVKMASLKRENAISDAQIGDIGTLEDNQTSNTKYGYLTPPPPSPARSGSGRRRSRNQCQISISIHDLFTGYIRHLFTFADGGGDVLDLLSTCHRAAPPYVSPLAGLG